MNQIVETVNSLLAVLKSAAHANPAFMTTAEKAEALVGMVQVESIAAELRLRIEASAGDVAEEIGARDAGSVLTARALADPRQAHADLKLAQGLERWEVVRAGLAEGLFTVEHARVIVRALDELPTDVPAAIVAKAETQLCDWAAEFTPRELRQLAGRIVSTVAPELGEEADAKAIQRLEAESAARATLSITPQGDGTTRLHGLVPDAVGVRLRTVLESFAQPRVAALEADGKVRPRSRLMAEALGQLLETVDADTLPSHGGDATTVIVTVPLAQLRAELGIAEMGETLISAAEARRLACTAAIIPAVLGGQSEILDLGRSRRLHSPAQRKALRLRDGHCRAEGCSVPAAWCDVHHAGQPWSRGGRTDLADGALLCGHHHRRAHDPAYDTTRLPNGEFRFHRRR